MIFLGKISCWKLMKNIICLWQGDARRTILPMVRNGLTTALFWSTYKMWLLTYFSSLTCRSNIVRSSSFPSTFFITITIIYSLHFHDWFQGDSGSPAQCDLTGQGDWTIVGLNSWGTGPWCSGATNAFVRLTWFLDWIREHVPGLPGSKPWIQWKSM